MSDEIKDEVNEDVEGHGPRFIHVEAAGETEGHRQNKGVSDADEDDAEGHRVQFLP